MAQLTQCDRCGTTDGLHEQVIVRGVRVDLCTDCMAAIFSPWLEDVLARVTTVPMAPGAPTVPTRQNAWPRPPQHGYTAAAIEAAQDPSPTIPADPVLPQPEPDLVAEHEATHGRSGTVKP